MGIEKFYTQSFTHTRNVKAKVNGVLRDTETSIGSFVGILDPNAISRIFDQDKDTFITVSKLFHGYSATILKGDYITYDSVKYDVIAPINPLSKGHHYETLVRRRD